MQRQSRFHRFEAEAKDVAPITPHVTKPINPSSAYSVEQRINARFLHCGNCVKYTSLS